jgi:(2Fe-2S) ferredoxin
VLHEVFRSALDARSARETTELVWQSCFGRCTQGPNVLVREILTAEPGALVSGGFATLPGPRGVTALYNRVDALRVPRIIDEHVTKGQIVREFVERPGIQASVAVASTAKDTEQ